MTMNRDGLLMDELHQSLVNRLVINTCSEKSERW